VSAALEPVLEKTADRLRDQFLVTLRELDRRRQRAMDLRGLLRENRRVLIAAGAGLAALVVVVVGTSVALARVRARRLPRRRLEALSRAWENPDRVATRDGRSPRPAAILLALVKIAAVAAGSQLVRRTALPART
jgi:hypothetical protein